MMMLAGPVLAAGRPGCDERFCLFLTSLNPGFPNFFEPRPKNDVHCIERMTEPTPTSLCSLLLCQTPLPEYPGIGDWNEPAR
jgi:hypothetical protein